MARADPPAQALRRRYDIYGKGVGPLTGDYPATRGQPSISEEAHGRILGMPVFIDEEPGYSDGVIEAFGR